MYAGGRKVGVVYFSFCCFFGLDMELTMGIEENDEWTEFDNGFDDMNGYWISCLLLPLIFLLISV